MELQHFKATEQFRLFGLLFLLVIIAYGPVLTHNYAFADDFYYLGTKLTSPDWFSSLIAMTTLQGRPLTGLMIGLGLKCCTGLSDFLYFHAFALLATSVLTFLIYRLAHQSGWTKVQSLCLALTLVSLPPFQVILAWSTTAFFVVSVIFALISLRLAVASEPSNLAVSMVSATFWLVLAMAIYQPTSMTYWTFAAIYLAQDSLSKKQRWSALLRIGGVFFLAAFLNLMIFELAKFHYGTAALLPQRSHLTTHPWQKISWFLNGPLIDALNFNYLLPSRKIAVLTGLFNTIGLCFYFKLANKQKALTFLSIIPPLAIAIIFIPLSYVPNLAIAENFYSYRTEFGLGTLMLFYAFLSAKAFLKNLFPKHATQALTATMVIACVLNLYSAHTHIREFFVKPQVLEQKQIKSQLRGDYGPERQKRPLLLDRNQTLAPFTRYDEFGIPSFSCPWVKEPGMVLLRREIEKEKRL